MSFQQGLSGLNAAAKSLDVTGNNVANAATVGFKSSRAEFGDVFAASLQGAGTTQIGLGTSVLAVTQQFSQGNITASSNPLDLAINGRGFFRMDQNGAITYTRNGQFQIDKDNFIVDQRGLKLTGFARDSATGTIDRSAPVPLQLDTSDQPPQATGATAGGGGIDALLNLDSNQTAPVNAFSVNDTSSYNHSTSLAIYDSQGNSYNYTMYFRKTAANTWDVYRQITNSQGGTSVSAAAVASLSFNAAGVLTTAMPLVGADSIPLAINLTAAAGGVFDLDFTGTTQFGTSFGVNSLSQDGYASGKLVGLASTSDGVIQGRYTNGQTRDLGVITLSSFPNPQGLQPIGNNQWQETSLSGNPTPVAGEPGTGSLGVLQAAAVEESNVDLTAELVNMITAQRIYQANAQTIKTQDAVLQTLVNLR
jgi:flagellar hook protein FlgE